MDRREEICLIGFVGGSSSGLCSGDSLPLYQRHPLVIIGRQQRFRRAAYVIHRFVRVLLDSRDCVGFIVGADSVAEDYLVVAAARRIRWDDRQLRSIIIVSRVILIGVEHFILT